MEIIKKIKKLIVKKIKVKISTQISLGFVIVLSILFLDILIMMISINNVYATMDQLRIFQKMASQIQGIFTEEENYFKSKDRKYSESVVKKIVTMNENSENFISNYNNSNEHIETLRYINKSLTNLNIKITEYEQVEEQKQAIDDKFDMNLTGILQIIENLKKEYTFTQKRKDVSLSTYQLISDIAILSFSQKVEHELNNDDAIKMFTKLEAQAKQQVELAVKLKEYLSNSGYKFYGYRLLKLLEQNQELLKEYKTYFFQQMKNENNIKNSTDDLGKKYFQMTESLNLSSKNTLNKAKGNLIIIFIITVTIALFFGYIITRRIKNRMKALLAATKQIKEGNYNVILESYGFDEMDTLSESIGTMAESLKNSESRMRQYNKILEDEVSNRTEELSNALDNLKSAQKHLIQSEKLAAMGQLIAGIAHEINTPLGAINSSIGSMKNIFEKIIHKFPEYISDINNSELDKFYEFIKYLKNRKHHISLKEETKIKRQMFKDLKESRFNEINIENREEIIDYLFEMGIYNVDQFFDNIGNHEYSKIIEILNEINTFYKSMDTIFLSVNRATKVVNALRRFTHFDNKLIKKPENILESIETTLILYHNKIKNNVIVETNFDEIPMLECNLDEMNQLWNNLISNALQAMDYMGKLIITVKQEDNNVIISINDSGKGIKEEDKEYIFQPFFTTKSMGDGSGLGLDICNTIVDNHNGKIWFESKPKDTTFYVLLPIKQ